MQLIMSLVGMAVLIAIAVLLSSNRRAIKLRTVAWAFIIQIGIGALVLYVPLGRSILGSMVQAQERDQPGAGRWGQPVLHRADHGEPQPDAGTLS